MKKSYLPALPRYSRVTDNDVILGFDGYEGCIAVFCLRPFRDYTATNVIGYLPADFTCPEDFTGVECHSYADECNAKKYFPYH